MEYSIQLLIITYIKLKMKNLVIVESPAKTKKIASFLGDDYQVMSSVGHIRDLPKSALGVDTQNKYEPIYQIYEEKKDIVNELKKVAKTVDCIYLAPDLDREGEAIAWHLGHILNNEKPLKPTKDNEQYEIADKIKNKKGESPKVYRVVFNSITKDEVVNAFKSPRKLNYDLIDAQQARRVLDRLVGYKLSPLLWEKIRYGLSAGRVQSVAVRFIVEREREIASFATDPYYEIFGNFDFGKEKQIKAKLITIDQKSIYIKKNYDLFAGKYTVALTTINTETKLQNILNDLNKSSFQISDIQKKQTKSYPGAPFTTSTLQQSAGSFLGYTPSRTMQLAQKLYEQGFITYMRTDSVYVLPTENTKIRSFIKSKYGTKYLSNDVRVYKNSKENKVQEAHEAIRPTDIKTVSTDLPKALTEQHRKLYDLIWKRTVASQMQESVYENTKVYIDSQNTARQYVFEAKGVQMVFDGFNRVYHSLRKEEMMPDVNLGGKTDEYAIINEAKSLTPPPRYNEASLVKVLESFGIGRPSTYASIISTIQSRGYVNKLERSLYPTDNGIVVNDMLVKHFPKIVDVDFTAHLEEELDEVALGQVNWRKLIGDFYEPFAKEIDIKKKEIKKEDLVVLEKTDKKCPECAQGNLIVKLGKFGRFYSCERFPDCKYAEPILDQMQSVDGASDPALVALAQELEKRKCPDCQGELKIKQGRFGNFIACQNYPKCKHTEQILNKIGLKCPKCGDTDGGEVVAKKTKKSRLFYGCSNYPKCDYASWKNPMLDNSITDTKAKAKAKVKKATKAKTKK